MSKKFTIVTLLLISVSVSNVPAATRIAKIIGGHPANSSAWPWMAGLVFKHSSNINGVFCGASLIATDWVLTAAHCVFYEDSSTFDVIINQAQLESSGGERLTVDHIVIHPLYNDFTLKNDLALIKLATPSENSPVKILSSFTVQDHAGKPAIALGWGTTSATTEQYPSELHKVNLPIISTSLCTKVMGDITDNMLCAGDGLGTKDTCFGDSGGPLIIYDKESNSWRQAGITSWGFGCAEPGFYGVYTRVKNFARFISDQICAADETPAPVELQLDINGKRVDLNWSTSDDSMGYRLNYAPYPDPHTIYSIDVNQMNSFSITLGIGSAYSVAITSYKDNCLSDFSNIEHFVIK